MSSMLNLSQPQVIGEATVAAGSALAIPPSWRPESVPVMQVDHDLPALGANAISPQALRHRFAEIDRVTWTPEFVREPPLPAQKPPRPASVLMAVTDEASPKVLLTQRTDHLNSHAGQIAFPGGSQDATDASPVYTALREAQEEVGLNPAVVQVLGTLPLYHTVTRFEVTPVVALIPAQTALQANPAEVASVFTVPLSFLMNPANHRHHHVVRDAIARHWLSMLYEDSNAPHGAPRFIWGATAAMLRNLYRFLAASAALNTK